MNIVHTFSYHELMGFALCQMLDDFVIAIVCYFRGDRMGICILLHVCEIHPHEECYLLLRPDMQCFWRCIRGG
jgi:hypothetical protein